MTGRPFLGLVLSLVVEGRHWTRIRWEFDDAACGRVWQFTVAGVALAATLIWLEGNRYNALPTLLAWMPALLMPMQFVQSYGLREALPVGELSFLARRRQERNQRFGIVDPGGTFQFGNVMFITAMLAASVGKNSSSWLFLPGVLVLGGWMLMSAGRGRLWLLLPLLTMTGVLAYGGRIALERAEEWLGGTGDHGRGAFNPNFSSTMIGSPGPVRQSPDIVWRLWPAPGTAPPRLLRTATFNTYLGTNWQNQRVPALDFDDLLTRLIDDEVYYMLEDVEYETFPGNLPWYMLRGTVAAESPLPLAGDAAALRDFELDGVERNSFGSVRVFPRHPVIEGRVYWRGHVSPESPPLPHEDLRIPIAERDVVRDTLESLGIDAATPFDEKLARVRGFFLNSYRYTLSPEIRHGSHRARGPTAIARFLTDERAGHCEYFATAAALLLRDAGVPTRYVTGYAVMERDARRGGYVIRGTHGHAWCRVWNPTSGVWVDFDPTPPAWLGAVGGHPALVQRFHDAFKRLREDFYLWRNRTENRLLVTWGMLFAGIVLTVFIARRLWRSRRELDRESNDEGYGGEVVRTPLHSLEKFARKRLGERPPGLPFAMWLSRMRDAMPDAEKLDRAIAIHQRLRFDPEPPAPDDLHLLVGLVDELRNHLRRDGGG